MIKENLVLYFENSLKSNWEKPAFSDYKSTSLTYKEVAERIIKLHILFEKLGVEQNDKIALIGKNSSSWAIIYLAAVTYGAVIVPILPDFKPNDVQNLINHSDSILLFAGDSLSDALVPSEMPAVKAIISIHDYSAISDSNGKTTEICQQLNSLVHNKYPDGFSKEHVHFTSVNNDRLAVISYTSGTTGHSKGVMLSHNSLAANIRFAQNNMPLKSGDCIVSFLPLAHAYGCAFEFLFPFSLGCHITFLTKTPSPQIITQAFGEIKPRLILSVPLVIEKIYKKQIIPLTSKPLIKLLLWIPGINLIIYKKTREKLIQAFGGNFHEVVIGGAAFNADAERFFKKLNFPFSVGYGMTECGPLISYSGWNITKFQSSGRSVDTLIVKIDSKDPENEVGEIILKGDNLMEGYYKNPEATRNCIDKDGWLHTGDLGLIDKDGFIFIKGRSKNMLLGSSGQNIYPEEIESVINNKYCVFESVVIEDNGKLIALINPDYDMIRAHKISNKELARIMEHNRKEVNHQLPAFMNVAKFVMHPEEFEKTPKRSIKRYLYTADIANK